ncbi:MAG: formate--tetrahydrofolate ligase [Candidatus Omnitrophica bacterium]|nr:formate--tetrahydrofolate ligase [Candidatus Omnitrophota bacterium]
MIKPKQIIEIAKSIGIRQDEVETYGSYKAKVSLGVIERLSHKPNAKLINVTSVTPTKFGEGKTSTAIGLTQALGKLKKKTALCIREPSLGPIFGVKGGGCGKGLSQVIPMEDINLHFTRDNYAISSAHNLLAAMLDNHIYSGNKLDIDKNKILWRRVIDLNDRSLRHITVSSNVRNMSYETGFDITASSEIMAILALTTGIGDLKERLSRVIVAYTKKGRPVTAKDLNAVGAMASLLTDTIKPNIVQTMEEEAVFIHTGPFANVAHGNSSFLSLVMASKLADYVVTENGFGTDLGAEKFFDIVCRMSMPGVNETLKPSVSVIVVSTRSVREHGGMQNLEQHVGNIKKFGIEPVVAINKFHDDNDTDLDAIKKYCHSLRTEVVVSEVVEKGGEGGIEMAQACLKIINSNSSNLKYIYNLKDTIEDKISKIAKQIYAANSVVYTDEALEDIKKCYELGLDKLPINIAKTHLSLSDDPLKKGVPSEWKLKIRNVRIARGAGFIVPIAGKIELMPGLPPVPAAEKLDIDDEGNITGLA